MAPRRYRVDFDAEAARILNELMVADRSTSSDLRELENDLQTAPMRQDSRRWAVITSGNVVRSS